MMPTKVKYVNFRATLPGEHEPNAVSMKQGYRFVGGVYEARLSENHARIAHNVLTAYFRAETEEVMDETVPEEGESAEPATSTVPEMDSEDGAGTGDGSKTETTDGEQHDPANAGEGELQTQRTDGQAGTDSENSTVETNDLV